MNNNIKSFDPVPQLPMAGKGAVGDVSSAAACVAPDKDPSNHRPDTPPQYKKYRDSYQQQPGIRFIHTGLVDAKLPPTYTRFGIRTCLEERIGDCLAPTQGSDMQAYLTEQQESIYHSNIREPLGRSYQRGHILPTAKDPDHAFGKSNANTENAKNLIYFPVTEHPNEPRPSSVGMGPQARGNSFTAEVDVTKKLNRDYDWNKMGIDSAKFRFGSKPIVREQGVRNCLQRPSVQHSSTIVKRSQEEVRAAQTFPLGRTRAVRGDVAKMGADFAFGYKPPRDQWGTKECIKGAYSEKEQQPDVDLGISRRRLKTLQQVPFDGTRRYGVPSIRTDLPYAPKAKSVSNAINWGDEVDAKALLYPSKYDFDGVDLDDFSAERNNQEIKYVFERMGARLSEEDYARISKSAVEQYGVLSVDSFRSAWNSDRVIVRDVVDQLSDDNGTGRAAPVASTGMNAYRNNVSNSPQLGTQRAPSPGARNSIYRQGYGQNPNGPQAVGVQMGAQQAQIGTGANNNPSANPNPRPSPYRNTRVQY